MVALSASRGYPSNDFAEMGFTLLPNGAVLISRRPQQPGELSLYPVHQHMDLGRADAGNLAELTGTPLTYGPAPVQAVGGVTYGPGPVGTYIAPGEIGPSILRPGRNRLLGRRGGFQGRSRTRPSTRPEQARSPRAPGRRDRTCRTERMRTTSAPRCWSTATCCSPAPATLCTNSTAPR